MTQKTMMLLGAAAVGYYLWTRREADPGKQEVVALPAIDPKIANAPARTTTLGPQEIQALVDGKGYMGSDGYVRYTETKG
jgi:hypothetical protein